MRAAVPGATATQHIRNGEVVADLLNHPGFEVLSAVLRIHGEGIRDRVIFRKPDPNPAAYADAVGHMRGLAEVEPLARGIVQNGKDVEARVKEEEVS
jgi:hypothetical protein